MSATRVSTALVLIAACALGCTSMRLTGVVRDHGTQEPIMGAGVVVGDKWTFTDPLGRYALKTDWEQCTIQVKAPGYVPASATVDPGNERYPVLDVALERDTTWLAGRPASAAPASREAGAARAE
jgi:hypothetical protein